MTGEGHSCLKRDGHLFPFVNWYYSSKDSSQRGGLQEGDKDHQKEKCSAN